MDIDLLSPDAYTRGQPFDQLLWLQEHEPIRWHHEFVENGPGFWAVTRYADLKEVEMQPDMFSSEPTPQISDAAAKNRGAEKMVIASDRPRHTVHRRFLGPELMPDAIRAFGPQVEAVVDEIIDAVVERGECDLVADVAGRLASYVTADWLGLPRDDLVRMYSVGDRIMNARSVRDGDGLAAVTEMDAYARTVWESRLEDPQKDTVTRLAHGDIGGVPMNEVQFILDLLTLITAGGDTTRNVVSGGMQALFDYPEQRERLQSDLLLIPQAVEEMLRWTTPIVYQTRRAHQDARIGDHPIAAGDKVVLFFGAANRDPRVFENPNTFDVARNPNPHVAFGSGPHFCLGARLARQELQVMFREILLRLPDIEPAGPARWQRIEAPIAPIIVGPKEMPVRFTPGRRRAHA